MPDGKFFFIRCKLNDMVLTVKDNIVGEGQPVQPYPSHGADNQFWYEDKLNGVIRLKANDEYCLEIQGDSLVINMFEPDEYNQRWKLAGDHVEHTEDSDKCLDIADCDEEQGARVCSYEYGGADNQLFSFEYIPVQKFYIKSLMNGKVIDIRRHDTSPGAKVHMWDCGDNEGPNQVFYEDKYGNIRTMLNDFVFDTSEEGKVRMHPYASDMDCRLWVKNGRKIVNKADPSICVEIRDADDGNGAKVNQGAYSGEDHQLWKFVYL